MVFAVDFDGTLCNDEYPEIGPPRHGTINIIKRLKSEGHKVILWTCRSGADLEAAVGWCGCHGIRFDAVNDNLAENIILHNNNSRKINADYYIDDKNLFVGAGIAGLPEVKIC